MAKKSPIAIPADEAQPDSSLSAAGAADQAAHASTPSSGDASGTGDANAAATTVVAERQTAGEQSPAAAGTAPAAAGPRFTITPREGGDPYAADNVHVAFARAQDGDQVLDGDNGNRPYRDVLFEQQNPKPPAAKK